MEHESLNDFYKRKTRKHCSTVIQVRFVLILPCLSVNVYASKNWSLVTNLKNVRDFRKVGTLSQSSSHMNVLCKYFEKIRIDERVRTARRNLVTLFTFVKAGYQTTISFRLRLLIRAKK